MIPAECKVWQQAYEDAIKDGAHPGLAARAGAVAVESRRAILIRRAERAAVAAERDASDQITRAALSVACDSLRAVADDLEALDRADSCAAASRIRAILRTLRVADPGKASA